MKPVYLLDTSIILEFSKLQPNQAVIENFLKSKNLCAISSISWQELNYCVKKLLDSQKKDYLTDFICTVQNYFEVIEYDSLSAKICGELMAQAEKSGLVLPYYDMQIAANAIASNMILITKNLSDFEKIKQFSNLTTENWFE